MDSWTSRDMQKESSLDAKDEDAKDLPIELRKLDEHDYSSVGIKSRSLGSILYPPQKVLIMIIIIFIELMNIIYFFSLANRKIFIQCA